MRNLTPPRQLQCLYSGILDVRISIDSIADQRFHNGVLRSSVEIIRVKLKIKANHACPESKKYATYVDKLLSNVGDVIGVRVVRVHILDGSEDPVRI